MLSRLYINTSRSLRKPLQRAGIHSVTRNNNASLYPRTKTLPKIYAADHIAKDCIDDRKRTPLTNVPLWTIIRCLFITSISSSDILFAPVIRMMLTLAHSENPILNPDKNPFLHFLLKKTFYAQFCGGETPNEVRFTVANLKAIGFDGVILTYAKEVVSSPKEAQVTNNHNPYMETAQDIMNEIKPWHHRTMETINLAEPGDFVAVKLTGCGRLARCLLSQNKEPTQHLDQSIHNLCASARDRGIRLIFDAEQDTVQTGIDSWTMKFAREYNTADTATLYGTYQAYRKATPATISRHLTVAQENGFMLGVKLVRGAYLNSDPRHCFWDTKAATDSCYNSIASAIITREWGLITIGKGEFPNTHLLLATHNNKSVGHAHVIYEAGRAKSGAIAAQLQGMADEVGYEHIKARHDDKTTIMPVYKYIVWGTTRDCMKYLVRRAYENRDAVQRTKSSRDATVSELIGRFKDAIWI